MKGLHATAVALSIIICCTLPIHAADSAPPWMPAEWPEAPRMVSVPHLNDPGRVIGIPPSSLPFTAKARSTGLPTFSRYMTVQGNTYKFTMVGRDVFAPRAKNVVVPVKIIPVRFDFPDGNVFDP